MLNRTDAPTAPHLTDSSPRVPREHHAGMHPSGRDAYMEECRQLALDYIQELTRADGGSDLYRSMLDYPMRAAKGLRPALCVASARALGAQLEEVLPSAAVVELYHNAFLIHDDVEDGSLMRRGRETLHRAVGTAAAINVGDAMLAIALDPLLDNMRLLDLSRALRILRLVARMARESAEGQAMELEWIRRGTWDLSAEDYVTMVGKKTAWYTFVTPLELGGIVAGRAVDLGSRLRELGQTLGIAFQIQDDLLNLEAPPDRMGKEAYGDLWEGKRTLMLTHYVRTAPENERARALALLSRPRPEEDPAALELGAELDRLVEVGELTALSAEGLRRLARRQGAKTSGEVAWLRRALEAHGSLHHARAIASVHSARARAQWLSLAPALAPGIHREFLESIVDYVTTRDW